MSHDTQLPDEFLDAAREAEEQIYQATPSRKAHEKKLRRELLQHARGERAGAQVFPFPVDQRGTTFAIITAAAAAAIAFVWCGSNLGAPPEVKESIVQPNALAKQHGLINTTPNCDATASPDGESIRIARECTWSWPAASAEFTPEDAPLQLAKAGDAMRIYKGKVRVEVDPERERTEPVRIDVGAGVIEVTGTAFTITQREDDRGEVFLHHGTIHFVFEDGDRVAVPKGTSLSWPRETAKLDPTPDKTAPDAEEGEVAAKDEGATTPPDERLEATSSKSKKVEKKRPPAKPKLTEEQERERAELDTKQLLEIRHLRRLGEHDEALRKLAALEKQTHSAYTREVISYEVGDIHVSRSNTARACAQWKRHIKRFPKGRYASSVRESMRREGCSE